MDSDSFVPNHFFTAENILEESAQTIGSRGKEYDNNSSERSFEKTAKAFEAITGKQVTSAEVALMLQILKDVRQWTDPTRLHRDSIIDGVSYAALKGEALFQEFK